MRFEWIEQHAAEFDVRAMCTVLDVRRAGYYAWVKRPVSKCEQANAVLDKQIEGVFAASRQTYGSPRVFHALKTKGVQCGENRVARRMQQNALIPVRWKKYRPQTTDSNHDLPIADNLLEQEFVATEPTLSWRYYIHSDWRRLALYNRDYRLVCPQSRGLGNQHIAQG